MTNGISGYSVIRIASWCLLMTVSLAETQKGKRASPGFRCYSCFYDKWDASTYRCVKEPENLTIHDPILPCDYPKYCITTEIYSKDGSEMTSFSRACAKSKGNKVYDAWRTGLACYTHCREDLCNSEPAGNACPSSSSRSFSPNIEILATSLVLALLMKMLH